MQAYARGLNDERLNQLRNTVSVLPDEARDGAYEKIGEMLDGWEQQQAEELHAARIIVDSELASMTIKTTNILSLSLQAGVIPYADKKPGGHGRAWKGNTAYQYSNPNKPRGSKSA